jgi:4-diphosphocytidyl-2-C-methyl-D-erythritol kinase
VVTSAGPGPLRELAPAKVNLCLFLGPVRDDGRHELVTLFESVLLCDELEISAAAADGGDQVVCPGLEGRNLVSNAIALLRERGWAAPPLHVAITKRIPVAGGMGGGSADAAALLRVAPQFAPVAAAQVMAVAAVLGADVPAQLRPGLVLGTGAGEVVRPVAPLAGHSLVIVPLEAQLSTAAVYAEADRLELTRSRDELSDLLAEVRRAVEAGGRLPASLLANDLESAARSLCLPITEALDAVRAAGADEALVSGSGPTVIGLYWDEDGRERAERSAVELRARFPGAAAVAPVSSQAFGKMQPA